MSKDTKLTQSELASNWINTNIFSPEMKMELFGVDIKEREVVNNLRSDRSEINIYKSIFSTR